MRASACLARLAVPVAAALLAGCGEDELPPVYLGAVDGGTTPTAPPIYVPSRDAGAGDADAGQPPPKAIASVVCSGTVSVASSGIEALSGIARSGDRVLVGLGGALFGYGQTDGCPSTLTPQVGPFGASDVGKVRSVATSTNGTVWASGPALTSSFDAKGKGVSKCEGLPARSLAADPASPTRVLAVTGAAELRAVDVVAGVCTVSTQALSNGEAALAIGGSSNPGTAWVATVAADSSRVSVRRYVLETGGASAEPALDDGGVLCGADAILETGGRVLVVDGACKRVLVFDAGGPLLGAVDLPAGAIPRGVVALPASTTARALIATATPGGSGVVAGFVRVDVPSAP